MLCCTLFFLETEEMQNVSGLNCKALLYSFAAVADGVCGGVQQSLVRSFANGVVQHFSLSSGLPFSGYSLLSS